MGRVLLCVSPDGRLVAVKLLHAELARDPGFRARFRREVEATRMVSGAYTAPVMDADATAETPWLASVFVPGPSLREAVDAVGALPVESVLHVAAGLAQALLDLHRVGLVHRDLKPSNVMLAADGVRVIDFGIARAAESADSTELTHASALIGSPAFMSPEQAEGHELTPASDVFSLGATLAVAGTGNAPFGGRSTPQLLYNVVHTEPDLSALTPRLREIVEPCLAKDPGARPTPQDLLELIGRIAPTPQPWPSEVHQLLADQHAELASLIGGAVHDSTVADVGPGPTPEGRAATAAGPAPIALLGPALAVTPAHAVTPTPVTPVPVGAAPAQGGAPQGIIVPAGPPRRRAPLALGVVLVLVAGAVGAVLTLFNRDKLFEHPLPQPYRAGGVPTPGSTPLSAVADKYVHDLPACKDITARLSLTSDTKPPYEAAQPEKGQTRCVWEDPSGNSIDVYWRRYRTGQGTGTGAEQAKASYEGYYMGPGSKREQDIGFAEEGQWIIPRDSSDSNCGLYVRDVNLVVMAFVKGPKYPANACEPDTKALLRGVVGATTP
ncbi:serine/threonine protein kinase [Solihabitans fulvus]|uniref:Serine/threonine protein kinase n=2 Tax=Solihabitans fulvus TaxID=1892852 RepID=A0A5B2XBM2_9PSEU|nr:serine/threonine protein kinase [Solihabitans fulvus]